MFGYNGNILRVDLTNSTIALEHPNEKFFRTYWGGRSLALYYMLNEMKKDTSPFSKENLLIFSPSVVVGTEAFLINRYTVCSKSPLTHAMGEAEAGGYWGPELKKAGLDAIIIKGISKKPVYLFIKDNQIEIRDAHHLWGKNTLETQNLLRNECQDDKIRIAQIGQGGENLVLFANISNELNHFNGRNGLGAVMGSKKLKAIAVRGTKGVKVYSLKKIKEINKEISLRVNKHPLSKALKDKGTVAGVDRIIHSGWLPTRNWNDNDFKEADKITVNEYHAKIFRKRSTCYACPISCKRQAYSQNKSIILEPNLGGPEYESLVSLGPLCGISDLAYIAKATQLCNKYTVDSISMGTTIAFAMNCYEEGILTKKETDGIQLNFGNKKTVLDLIKKIVFREGIGDILAQGTLKASKIFGEKSQKFLRHVKGQEVPMHDPRVKVGVGLQYALADYGADHVKAPHDEYYAEENSWGIQESTGLGILNSVPVNDLGYDKLYLFKKLSILWSVFDILGICLFGYAPRGLGTLEELLELIRSISGWRVTWYELMQLGERSINMARIFNLREGLTKNDDKLPSVFFQNFKGGPLDDTGAIDKTAFQKAIHLYYDIMGWDNETSIPSKGKLIELCLDWLIPQVES